MHVSSTSFAEGGAIPVRHTCDGIDVSPPLTVTEIPSGTRSLVLIMDDPDAPSGTWDHWVAFDVPVTSEIAEGIDALGTPGLNSWGLTGYRGPCCPHGQTHRYVTRLYALDGNLGLARGATKGTVLGAMAGHVVADATLMGRYSR
jgi:Raf kinase inhibitor-like YbhB/YbcL family protein